MMRVEEDTPVVVEVGFHNHSVQRRGYHGGWAAFGSCGEPFPMELQVPNFINIRVKTSTVYLARAEFGMNYLDYTVWKNAKYRKRDFFIWFRSGNTRDDLYHHVQFLRCYSNYELEGEEL
ncbi:hypothetical protein GOBAR_AA27556 [Gossypium barbadense]|uniref:Uncharacterized protein n=1 Tax=Gossypium barbadense TaxID=3634 RepID=A0A2P5WPU4_GOSBA|nr:hypothetical protein GOBAR_AA27556 [Gossypium barbadense]